MCSGHEKVLYSNWQELSTVIEFCLISLTFHELSLLVNDTYLG